MDSVFVRGLRVAAIVGILPWERRVRQTLVFDLELAADVTRAAASDAIADTLDYQAVSHRVSDFVGASDFGLLETLAERTVQVLMDEFHVPWLRLSVSKPNRCGAAAVGLTIERGARPGG
ncbi:MAG TPA: dihydroneopterin aldolase [Gammaproteobacteria bacterium]|nr:dihydroneopterin aldolase [Gammaproteobacteria bacterium]